jgi:hypothetical protein
MPDIPNRSGRNAALFVIALSAHEPGGAIKMTIFLPTIYGYANNDSPEAVFRIS